MEFIAPSNDESDAVVELKVLLNNAENVHTFTDLAIIRFLRGRQHIKEKTLNGLKKHVEWRLLNNVDNIHIDTAPFESELAQRKVFTEGCDLNKRPVIYIVARNHHKDKRDIDQIRALIIYTLEAAIKKSRLGLEYVPVGLGLTLTLTLTLTLNSNPFCNP
jgi:hypothetical protein